MKDARRRFVPRLCHSFISTRWFCTVMFAVSIAGVAQSTHAAFAVATVRPAPRADPSTGHWSPPGIGRFSATHVPLTLLLKLAYGIDETQIVNGPGWLKDNLYDVEAKPEDGVKLTRDELRPRLQDLLQQRFHLHAHTEIRSTRGYALTIAKGGPHLTPTKGAHFPGYRVNVSPGNMYGENWSLQVLAKYLTSAADFPVVDQTGLKGAYDLGFSYNPTLGSESDLPSLGVALKQATGLLLKPQHVPLKCS